MPEPAVAAEAANVAGLGRPNRHGNLGPGARPPAGANFLPIKALCESTMTAKRNRRKQTQSLQERLATFAETARERARSLPPGKERDMLLRRAKQNDATSHLTEWLSTPVYPRRGG
ncbi:hypothetical protein ABIA99_007277 [Bradyrhizobium sp. LB12.1]|jgi:hypothetical protein